jgi:hypothetical protein
VENRHAAQLVGIDRKVAERLGVSVDQGHGVGRRMRDRGLRSGQSIAAHCGRAAPHRAYRTALPLMPGGLAAAGAAPQRPRSMTRKKKKLAIEKAARQRRLSAAWWWRPT